MTCPTNEDYELCLVIKGEQLLFCFLWFLFGGLGCLSLILIVLRIPYGFAFLLGGTG